MVNFPINQNLVSQRIAQLESIVDQLASKISAKNSIDAQAFSGKPVPNIISGEVNFPLSVRTPIRIQVDSDATFLAKSIHFASRFTTFTTAEGNDNTSVGVWNDWVQFFWEYEVTGSRRRRMNAPVPSQIVVDAEWKNGSFDFYVEDVFSPGSVVTVWITYVGISTGLIPGPGGELSAPSGGVLWVGFSGNYVTE